MSQNIIQPYRHVSPPIQVCNFCIEGSNCATYAVNPTTSRQQYGYRLDADADAIGKKLTQMTLRLNNDQAVGATGTLGVYSKDTKVGTLDVSTFSSTSYADFAISCSGSPVLAENDVIWWENDSNRDGNGNINTKVIASSFSNPTNYTYVQDSDTSYGVAPSTPVTSNVANICFTVE